MVQINTITIDPPLLNASCAWASDFDQLKELYLSPYTGAVTIRTATQYGFQEDATHNVAFAHNGVTSINSYGYSPHPLSSYIGWIETLIDSDAPAHCRDKAFIISIAASTAAEFQYLLTEIQAFRAKISDSSHSGRVAIELNISCPNIPGSPPKGYILDSDPLMQVLLSTIALATKDDPSLTVGLKLPPYLYTEQFMQVLRAISGQDFIVVDSDGGTRNSISFLTCTNTLGNSLLLADQVASAHDATFAVQTALGGLAGESLHPLALGNVYTFSQLLQAQPVDTELSKVKIIGVGGVTTPEAAKRMVEAGACAVGCASLLGAKGVEAFAIITGK